MYKSYVCGGVGELNNTMTDLKTNFFMPSVIGEEVFKLVTSSTTLCSRISITNWLSIEWIGFQPL